MVSKVIVKVDEVSNNNEQCPADVCSCPILITYLMRGKLYSSVDVNKLKGHGKVLVAICSEGALGFGGIVHSM